MNNDKKMYLAHYGVKGMHWGVRKDGKPQGFQYGKTVFVSGSSKTEFKDNPYHRKKLPKGVQKELKEHMRNGDKIIVGDAPGVDRQTQNYLKKKHYKNVEVYSPGKESRYLADKKWKNNLIDAPEFEPGSSEWLAKKDKAMQKAADKGIAVILDQGSAATRRNIDQLIKDNKGVSIYELSLKGKRKDRKLTRDEYLK